MEIKYSITSKKEDVVFNSGQESFPLRSTSEHSERLSSCYVNTFLCTRTGVPPFKFSVVQWWPPNTCHLYPKLFLHHLLSVCQLNKIPVSFCKVADVNLGTIFLKYLSLSGKINMSPLTWIIKKSSRVFYWILFFFLICTLTLRPILACTLFCCLEIFMFSVTQHM